MKIIQLFVTHIALISSISAAEPTATPKDPFEGVFDDPFVMSIEYSLSERPPRLLETYKVIPWSKLNAIKSGALIEGQIDGFIKIYSAEVESGKDKGKTVYRYFLYKTKEDMKYKRLSSCIMLKGYSKGVLPNNRNYKDPMDLDGKYCIAAGVFRRVGDLTAVSAEAVQLATIFLK